MGILFRRLIIVSFILLLALAALVPFASAQAAAGSRCFPETGQCISGAIRTYWERNGGLPVFGYPISAQRNQTIEGSWGGPTQWFERDRLEDHGNEGKGVLAGRLGDRALLLQGNNWHLLPTDSGVSSGCRYFRETQLNVCEPFLSYWQNNGGLARFGFPLTRAHKEQLEGREYTVQYFERRRMELHPENAGTPYAVQLGLLGRDVFAAEGDEGLIEDVPGDLLAEVQQPILDTAYAAVRASYPRAKLAVGLADLDGQYAVALALPRGEKPIFVFLKQQRGAWKVLSSTASPAGAALRQLGFPEPLWAANDRVTVIRVALEQIQDPRGEGLNEYLTRPRIAGDVARLSASPGAGEQIDGVSMFFKRNGGTWSFLTAGTAFPEDTLRELGVPADLWQYGASVQGPAA